MADMVVGRHRPHPVCRHAHSRHPQNKVTPDRRPRTPDNRRKRSSLTTCPRSARVQTSPVAPLDRFSPPAVPAFQADDGVHGELPIQPPFGVFPVTSEACRIPVIGPPSGTRILIPHARPSRACRRAGRISPIGHRLREVRRFRH